MKGMSISKFLNKIYDGDEIEFKLGTTTYFVDGNKENAIPYRSSGGPMMRNDYLKRQLSIDRTSPLIIKTPITSVIKPGIERFTYTKITKI